MGNCSAISALDPPRAAARTIWARSRSRYSVRPEASRAVRVRSSSSVRTITYGLDIDMWIFVSCPRSAQQRLSARARQRWPELARVAVRHHDAFTYLDGVLAEGATVKLCRLRYTGSAHNWGFAIYRASHDDYQESIFPSACPSAPAKTPSTPPATSTWAAPPPYP